jgi:hypothetical protein
VVHHSWSALPRRPTTNLGDSRPLTGNCMWFWCRNPSSTPTCYSPVFSCLPIGYCLVACRSLLRLFSVHNSVSKLLTSYISLPLTSGQITWDAESPYAQPPVHHCPEFACRYQPKLAIASDGVCPRFRGGHDVVEEPCSSALAFCPGVSKILVT